MAIYHLSAKPVRRSAGRSATAAAAYRAAAEVPDQRTGQTFDYTRKQGVEHSEIVLPTSAARQDINWARDRTTLWNAAELAENRKDSRVAREYEIALPAELNAEQRKELVQEFAKHIANRHGSAVDIAIHAPHRDGDQRNHHAHLLATTRQITPEGLGNKTSIELSDTDRKKRGMGPAANELEAIRQRWAEMSNEALQRHGHSARVDHRSLAAQREEAQQKGDQKQAAELDREPTKHLGVAATALERRGQTTDLGDINRRIAEAAEVGRLQRENKNLDGSILDLSGDLAGAIKDRDHLRDHLRDHMRSLQPNGDLAMEARRQAREVWAEIRGAGKDAKEQLGLWKQGMQKPGAQRSAPQKDGLQRSGPERAGPNKPSFEDLPTLGGFKTDRSLHDRILAMGGRAADPQELERLLREWILHQQQQDKEQREERERGERQAGAGRSPHDPRTQHERERENALRRHQDKGLER